MTRRRRTPTTPAPRGLARRLGSWLLGLGGLVALLAVVSGTAPRWARWLKPPPPLDGLPTSAPPPEPPSTGRIVVQLFFETADRAGLAVEERSVRFEPDLSRQVRVVVEEWLRGSQGGLLASLPDGARVLEVFVTDDGEAVVDLSLLPAPPAPGATPEPTPPEPATPEPAPPAPGSAPHASEPAEPEFVSAPLAGSREELLAVYGLVNTVAMNFPAVRRVRLLLDDKPATSLAGHVDLGHPLYPDMTYLLPPPAAEPAPPIGAGTPEPAAPHGTTGPAEGDAP